MNRKTCITACILAGSAVLCPSMVLANVLVDFSPTGEYAASFRAGSPSNAQVPSEQTSGPNIYMQVAPGTLVAAYDTTPADGTVKDTFTVTPTTPLTISMDVNIGTNTSSAGFYLINPANESAGGVLGLLNLNNVNANVDETFRVWNAISNPLNGSVGTAQGGTTSIDAGLTTNQWFTLSMTYSINGSNQGVIDLTAGSYTKHVVMSGSPLTSVEAGIRLAVQGTQVQFDNFTITQVPEPASLMLLAVGGLTLASARRRRGRCDVNR